MIEENLDIKQIPEPDNQQAVVIATIKDENGTRQGIGAVCNHSRDIPFDPQVLLDKATRQALDRVRQVNTINLAISDTAHQEQHRPTPASEPKHKEYTRKHNTTPGSVSDKQLSLLWNMAQERNQNLAAITDEQFGSEPKRLSSEQADSLVKYLKTGANR